MTRDDEVFGDALDLPTTERESYLERVCAGDEALRARVEAMLALHDEAPGFLERPLARPTAVLPEEEPGDLIGRYKLLQKIGEGGCGVVWMAEQEEPVRRRVALKVIKLGMDTKAVIARFEAERTARIWDVATGLPLTPPFLHGSELVTSVAFSPNARFVTTQAHVPGPGGLQTQRVWPAPPVATEAQTPRWLLRLATICAGKRLAADGRLVSAEDEIANMEELRREIATLPESAPYVEWARWFLSHSPTRSIAPGFTITPVEAKKLSDEFAAPAKPTAVAGSER